MPGVVYRAASDAPTGRVGGFHSWLKQGLFEEGFAVAPVGHAGVHEGVEAGTVVHVF